MELHVSKDAYAGGDGSANRPFRTISEAAACAKPGDTVLVQPGIYREWVNPPHGGTKDQRITFQSVVKGGAIITGTEIIGGWEEDADGVFMTQIPYDAFSGDNPFLISALERNVDDPPPGHPVQLFADSVALYEAATKEALYAAAKGKYPVEMPKVKPGLWWAQTDSHLGVVTLYAYLTDDTMNAVETELSCRPHCFYATGRHIDAITLSGFVLRGAFGKWDIDATSTGGLAGCAQGHGWILEDCTVCDTTGSGISFGVRADPKTDTKWYRMFSKDDAQLRNEECCRLSQSAWNRALSGGHIVRRCHIHHCGQAGIVARYGGLGSVFSENHIHHIDAENRFPALRRSGILLQTAIDAKILQNRIHHCHAGLMLMHGAQGVCAFGNLLHDNEADAGADLMLLGLHGPVTIANNLLLSPQNLVLDAQGVLLEGNLWNGEIILCEEKCGHVPYFLPHETRVAGIAPIRGGDLHVRYNVFLHGGTKMLSAYPLRAEAFTGLLPVTDGVRHAHPDARLPVTLTGNVYCNDASRAEKETGPVCDIREAVTCHLREEGNGKVILESNLCHVLHSRTFSVPSADMGLSEALFAEQPFVEDADEASFREDYFGRREAFRTLPGPFILPDEKLIVFDPALSGETEAEDAALQTLKDSRIASFSCAYVLSPCDSIALDVRGTECRAQEMFIAGNVAWIHAVDDGTLYETDCAYGISKSIDKWTMEAEEAYTPGEDEALLLIAEAVMTLHASLNGGDRSLGHRRKLLLERASALLGPFGITMRLTENYLKFIREREKQFLSLEEVVRTVTMHKANDFAEVLP